MKAIPCCRVSTVGQRDEGVSLEMQRERIAGWCQVRAHVPLDAALGEMLQRAMEQLSLSARAYDRILKVARTIADLAASERVEQPHLLEAIPYRSLDRNVFY